MHYKKGKRSIITKIYEIQRTKDSVKAQSVRIAVSIPYFVVVSALVGLYTIRMTSKAFCTVLRVATRRQGQLRAFSAPANSAVVTINFKRRDGSMTVAKGKVGDNLLRLAQRYDIELEGACEGVCACSTCHVILPDDLYDQLEEASELEEDMLDMAFGLTPTSRLGCQVLLDEDMDNTVIELPKATRNFYVDGHVPKPH